MSNTNISYCEKMQIQLVILKEELSNAEITIQELKKSYEMMSSRMLKLDYENYKLKEKLSTFSLHNEKEPSNNRNLTINDIVNRFPDNFMLNKD